MSDPTPSTSAAPPPAAAPAPASAPTKRGPTPSKKPARLAQHPLLGRANTILEGDNVMLKLPSGIIKPIKLVNNSNISLGKYGTFNTRHLINQPYGHTFEVLPGGELNVVRATIAEVQETAANNQNILSQSKGLEADEVARMKAEGLSGREIIAKQIEEHGAFDLKTEYSKDKYMKRKEAKFLQLFTVLEPTLHAITEHHFTKDPDKTRDLRPDSLAHLLALANVRPGARVLVVDSVHGLVAAACLERMAGQGRVMLVSDVDSPPDVHVSEAFNFNEEALRPLGSLNWAATVPGWEPSDLPVEVGEGVAEGASKNKVQREAAKLRKRRAALEQANADREDFFRGQYDGVILATDYEPFSVLSTLLPYIAGSASIAVYSPHLETLYALQARLRSHPEFLSPSIHEPFLRRYQVLQGRTHPEMNGLGSTGCILQAYRVYDAAEANSYAANKRQAMAANKRRKLEAEVEAEAEAGAEASKEGTPVAGAVEVETTAASGQAEGVTEVKGADAQME